MSPHNGFTNSMGMEFIRIPAGAFLMGSPDTDTQAFSDEKPAHLVTISQPFYLGQYPVTQAQWQAVMGDNPSYFPGEDRPVESVSWEDVQAFVLALSEQEGGSDYRLPTEAEWEYACRAGAATVYSFGDDVSQLGAYAWYDDHTRRAPRAPQPVGLKLPNAWGLYDMHGNVWEWCQDRYGPYSAEAVIDPSGPPSGAYRVVRGGGWSASALDARTANRLGLRPNGLSDSLGFRCLKASGRPS